MNTDNPKALGHYCFNMIHGKAKTKEEKLFMKEWLEYFMKGWNGSIN